MKEDVEMTFGEHLEELRRRVIYALVGLLVATVLCAVNYPFLLSAMLRPYKLAYDEMIADQIPAPEDEEAEGGTDPTTAEDEPQSSLPDTAVGAAVRKIGERLAAVEKRLDAIAPQPEAAPDAPEDPKTFAERFPRPRVIQGGPLTGYITVILLCVICGIILGSPWILYQMWAFVGLGLHPHERKFIYIYGPFSFFLFVAGAATFYFVMLKYGLRALMGPTVGIMVDGVPLIDPSFFLNDYFKFVAMMTLVFGVVFQTPLIVMFLARTGIVPLGTLVKQQKIVLMVLIVLSAVLTPQDPVTMIMMAIPLVVLYQFGLLLSWISIRRRRRRARDEGDEPWDDYERENDGPWKEPDAGEQEPSQQPEPDQAQAIAEEEQAEDKSEGYEDPYAEFQGDDEEAYGYDDDYSWEQETYGESEADADEQASHDGAAGKPEDEGEPPADEAPADHEPADEDRADEPQDEFDEMPSDDDLPPEDRMK
jgi:sec-independent protein translocase protein TatC